MSDAEARVALYRLVAATASMIPSAEMARRAGPLRLAAREAWLAAVAELGSTEAKVRAAAGVLAEGKA